MRRVALAAAALMLLPGCGGSDRTPKAYGFDFSAEFRSLPAGVEPGAPVRVNGVGVGIVRAVERSPSGATVRIVLTEGVSFMAQDSYVRADARIDARPRIFAEGKAFLDLHPGSRNAAPLHRGDRIPATQTSAYAGP
jgi:ABC-type transporter Mla subunit MlaD